MNALNSKRLLRGGEKSSPPIIRGTCAFDSKNRVFLRVSEFVSAYVGRNKKFFRKIEICQKLPSFFAENRNRSHLVSRIFPRLRSGQAVKRQMKPFGRLVEWILGGNVVGPTSPRLRRINWWFWVVFVEN